MPRVQSPTGIVAFLFTDIEGSTKMWEAHPDEMRVSLARHDALMREAIGEAKGHVFKTIGDAFCAAFATPAEALEAALASQIALRTEGWPEATPILVRMAIHVGAVESRDDDYFGLPLNRTARLLSTAHGGQVLLTDVAYDLCRDSLASGMGLKPLGEHRLRDLGRPESIFQLTHRELPAEFPPLRSLESMPNNLPQQVTSFIGREKEVATVTDLLEKTRLLTLTGSGGCGKTRLSLQVAADVLDQMPDGVWLVELAALADPALVPQAVADSLGLKENPGKPILQSLIEHLTDKRMLLVLDNCEHLLDACSQLTETLLRQCPRVRVLATSREALGIAGELTYRVPSLALPDPSQTQSPDTLSHFEAVRLFVERALFHQPAFSVTNENAPALASVCFRLDGIPLAIELAAARIRSLTVEEVNQRLDQRFRLLTGGPRTALPRQQTLRSLIDWSYDLLDEEHQCLLCRLSVFSGSWTLSDAEAVCSGDPIEEWQVMDILASLVDKSLVTPEERAGATRYRMLETVREYAQDKLLESGEQDVWRERHLSHFKNLATRPKSLAGAERAGWLALVENEMDNMRAALDWSLREVPGDREEDDLGRCVSSMEFCTLLSHFWYHRCHFREGMDRCVRALAQPGAEKPTEARAKLLYEAGSLAFFRDAEQAEAMFLESCELCRQLGCPGLEGWNLIYVADLHSLRGNVTEAMKLYRESLALLRASNERLGEVYCLKDMALTARREQDLDLARALTEEALTIARELGDEPAEANCLHILGNIALYQKDFSEARSWLDKSFELTQKHGMLSHRPSILWNLGMVCFESGDLDQASAFLRQCLKLGREHENYVPVLEALMALARMASVQSDPERAALLYGAFAANQKVANHSIDPSDVEVFEQDTAAVRASLGDHKYSEVWHRGQAMSMDQAIDFVLVSAKD